MLSKPTLTFSLLSLGEMRVQTVQSVSD